MDTVNITEDEIVKNYSIYRFGNENLMLCIYKPKKEQNDQNDKKDKDDQNDKKDKNEQNNIDENIVTWEDVFIAFITSDKYFILQPEGNSIIGDKDNRHLFCLLDSYLSNCEWHKKYNDCPIEKVECLNQLDLLKERLIAIYNKHNQK